MPLKSEHLKFSFTKLQLVKLFKQLIILFFSILFICFVEEVIWFSLQHIEKVEIEGGYEFSDFIPAIDNHINFFGNVGSWWWFIYLIFTLIYFGTGFVFVYFYYGASAYWKFYSLSFLCFVAWFIVSICFPNYDYLRENHYDGSIDKNANKHLGSFVAFPSGHALVGYLPFLFSHYWMFKKKTKWHYLIIPITFISFTLIVLSTWFCKYHYFCDWIITIGVLEIVGFIYFFLLKSKFDFFYKPYSYLFDFLLLSRDNSYSLFKSYPNQKKVMISSTYAMLVILSIGLIILMSFFLGFP